MSERANFSEPLLLRSEDNEIKLLADESMSKEYATFLAATNHSSECLTAVQQIARIDHENWYGAWIDIANAAIEFGNSAAAHDHLEVAKRNWLRASNCYKVAKNVLQEDNQRRPYNVAQAADCSRRFIECLTPRGEVVDIECDDGGHISAYFIGASQAARNPAIIFFGDAELLKDELLQKVVPHSLTEGLSALVLDLPKHGALTGRRGVASHFDIEVPISLCFDYLSTRGDVDELRIGVYGCGFGGTYASRIAISDSRFAAAVCDGGIWDNKARALSYDWAFGETGGSIDKRLRRTSAFTSARMINCPFLIPVDEYDYLDAGEAIDLQRRCKEAGMDMDIAIRSGESAASSPSEGVISNKEGIFAWIAAKLALQG